MAEEPIAGTNQETELPQKWKIFSGQKRIRSKMPTLLIPLRVAMQIALCLLVQKHDHGSRPLQR